MSEYVVERALSDMMPLLSADHLLEETITNYLSQALATFTLDGGRIHFPDRTRIIPISKEVVDGTTEWRLIFLDETGTDVALVAVSESGNMATPVDIIDSDGFLQILDNVLHVPENDRIYVYNRPAFSEEITAVWDLCHALTDEGDGVQVWQAGGMYYHLPENEPIFISGFIQRNENNSFSVVLEERWPGNRDGRDVITTLLYTIDPLSVIVGCIESDLYLQALDAAVKRFPDPPIHTLKESISARINRKIYVQNYLEQFGQSLSFTHSHFTKLFLLFQSEQLQVVMEEA